MKALIHILLLSKTLCFSSSLIAWELAKEHAGISVYTSDVQGSTLKSFKAVTTVDSTLTGVVALLEDTSAGPDWLYSCLSLKRLQTASPTQVYNYSINDLPWPVKDRDAIIYSELKQDPQTLSVQISMRGLPNYLPENNNYVRIPYLTGEWSITPIKSGSMEISYTAHIEPGGNIPDWVVNALLVDTPMKTFVQMKTLLPQAKYQQALRAYIQSP